MGPCYVETRSLIIALTLATSAFGAGYAAPLSEQHMLKKDSYPPWRVAHHRQVGLAQVGLAHVSPWQAPYHTSRWYRGGPGAKMGLVAQVIIPPQRHPRYSYPTSYWNNYFYYPNYRDMYEF